MPRKKKIPAQTHTVTESLTDIANTLMGLGDKYYDLAKLQANAETYKKAIDSYGKAEDEYKAINSLNEMIISSKLSRALCYEELCHLIDDVEEKKDYLFEIIHLHDEIYELRKNIDTVNNYSQFDRCEARFTATQLLAELNDSKSAAEVYKEARQLMESYHKLVAEDDLSEQEWYEKYTEDYNRAKKYCERYEEHEEQIQSTPVKEKRKKKTTEKNEKHKKQKVIAPAPTPLIHLKHDNGCELKQLKKEIAEIQLSNEDVPKFNPASEEDIENLEKHFNNEFTYLSKAKKHVRKDVDVLLAPVAGLQNNFGVYANKNIAANDELPLGVYVGKRRKPGKKSKEAAAYIFEITNDKGEVIREIDGKDLRNWTAFLNHSPTPNVIARPIITGSQQQIGFFALDEIKEGQQLLFDYGSEYFLNLFENTNFKPTYLHPKDNWVSHGEYYETNKQCYADGSFSFDEKTCQDLQLGSQQWLIPKVFISIFENNVEQLQKDLTQLPDPDMYAISLDNIDSYLSQQHLTPLMLACYLGSEDCIDLLVKQHAEPNRCMFVAGYTPFSLLLKGKGEDDVVERIALKWLADVELMPYPFVEDINNENLLNYAVLRNSIELVNKILSVAQELNYDLSKNIASALTSILHKSEYIAIIRILFKAIAKDALNELISNGNLFNETMIASISEEHRHDLRELLKEQDIKVKIEPENLLNIEKLFPVKKITTTAASHEKIKVTDKPAVLFNRERTLKSKESKMEEEKSKESKMEEETEHERNVGKNEISGDQTLKPEIFARGRGRNLRSRVPGVKPQNLKKY